MKVVDIERVVILMRFIQYGWDEERKQRFDDNLRMMLKTQCEDLDEHDAKVRANVIDEYKKKIEFVEEWLFDDCKVFNPDVMIAFDTLKRYAEYLKRRTNNGSD